MPKIGMEPIRRKALVTATVAEIGQAGNLDVTVSQIAKRAGMSSALAHHYFGSKEQIFIATMRHTLVVYAAEIRDALAMADTPIERMHAIIQACFGSSNFRTETIATWLNFYVLAQTSDQAKRLLRIYHKRLHSNLVFNMRPLVGDRAPDAASRIAAIIDGIYLHEALGAQLPNSKVATAQVFRALDLEIESVK